MYYFGSGLTDIGLKKKVNQDSICLMISDTYQMGQAVLAVVCDGIGGWEKGEFASSVTTGIFAEWYTKVLPEIIPDLSYDLLVSQWRRLIEEINCRMMRYGREQGIRLGTTLTALLIIKDQYMIAHAGDSRVYIIDDDIRQVTEDHTFYNRELKAGRSDLNSLRQDPRRNRITRGIGLKDTIDPDFYYGSVDNKELVWLLCSDGLRHKITNAEFKELIRPDEITEEKKLTDIACELVSITKERGEKDNISVILIKASREKSS